jgi:ubiquinone/menaquinone biosynthesis C-methylase UbiE
MYEDSIRDEFTHQTDSFAWSAAMSVAGVLGDATALDIEDGSFDGAITRLSLHHIPVPSRAMAEMARVVARAAASWSATTSPTSG